MSMRVKCSDYYKPEYNNDIVEARQLIARSMSELACGELNMLERFPTSHGKIIAI